MTFLKSDYQSLPVTINDHHSGAQKSTGSIQIVLTSSSQMGNSRNISQLSMHSGDLCPVPDFDGKKFSTTKIFRLEINWRFPSYEIRSENTH